MPITLDDLRRYAVARSLFTPTTLKRALDKLGFVQADPIRAPARAQDLMLRHRVRNYRAGDLERHYAKLRLEEDFFINYGFMTSPIHALMHPRLTALPRPGEQYSNPWRSARWPAQKRKRAAQLLEFIRERGAVHPREVDVQFSFGSVRNYWGGSSNASTHLLDSMHYCGMLRVVRRDEGIRIYAAYQHPDAPTDEAARHARIDTLLDVAIRIYAPLPEAGLRILARRLRYGVPQWYDELKGALSRAKQRLSHAHIGGVQWYWPANEDPAHSTPDDSVRLLTPFDPIVWDRDRFGLFWGWTYRLEAYTPVAKRIRGYYALPILWRNRVIGWSNVSVKSGELESDFGYVKSPPRDRAFKRELAAELDRMRAFLRLDT
jgi:uncharacterized protein YcaQ